MDRIEAYRGRKFTIACAREKSGESPGAVFFQSLNLTDKAKLMNLFRLGADHGSFYNEEKFHLGGGLFEFKSHQIRMPFAYAKERGLILITHGFYRKTAKAPKQEIERAWRIFREDQEQTQLGVIKGGLGREEEVMKTQHEELMENPEFRKLYAIEGLVADATELLARLMSEAGVNKAELARRLGKSRSYVTQLLGGGANVTVRTLAEVAYALDAEVRIDARPRTVAPRRTTTRTERVR